MIFFQIGSFERIPRAKKWVESRKGWTPRWEGIYSDWK